jgi:quercetin dioxygenase-like cupin family protein
MRFLLTLMCLASLGTSADLDPAILKFQMPTDIQWPETKELVKRLTLYGDPTKPGLYVQLLKWPPGSGSRPHTHPNDRFVTVVSGTWWVGTGPSGDMTKTVPMPAGAFIIHTAGGIHYDGAKDEEAIVRVVGMGPGTTQYADAK